MCFSAEASFLAAGVTGVLGAYAMSRAGTPREWPLAAMPLIFGAQQAVEGLLWVHLPSQPESCATGALTFGFLFIAHVIWPVYAPMAVLLLEPGGWRRRAMGVCLAVGAGLSAYLLWGLTARTPEAEIALAHIVYRVSEPHPNLVALLYLAVICLSLQLSSRKAVAAMGAIVFLGAIAAFAFYKSGFQSIWCYFAALASLVLAGDLQRRRFTASTRPA